MPKGPKGQKRPADSIGCAVSVAKIATGEQEETTYVTPNRRKSGLAGAKARDASLSAKQRTDIGKAGANARWKGGQKMMETARSDLFQRFEHMKADDGLLDMKFFLGSVSEETVEAVCAEVNRLHMLVDKGDVKEVDAWGDSNKPV